MTYVDTWKGWANAFARPEDGGTYIVSSDEFARAVSETLTGYPPHEADRERQARYAAGVVRRWDATGKAVEVVRAACLLTTGAGDDLATYLEASAKHVRVVRGDPDPETVRQHLRTLIDLLQHHIDPPKAGPGSPPLQLERPIPVPVASTVAEAATEAPVAKPLPGPAPATTSKKKGKR